MLIEFINLLIGYFYFFRICCVGCGLYYREVMVYVVGGVIIILMLVFISMLKMKIGDFEGKFFLVVRKSFNCILK